MYRMKVDGVVFYDPSSEDTSLHVLNPKAVYELNKIDKLTFTLLPDNVMYDGMQKMKSIITLEQDEEVIFRGRVLETTTDLYNQRKVSCEGELSYLLDSVVRPYEFAGKAKDLFHQLIAAHNEQVDEYKRFEVGIITAIDDETETETDSEAYADTLAELRQMFVSRYKGYLRVRVVDGVRYLDYIEDFEDECGQAIEFGVNLVDIENRIDAGDVFSVLIPLGGYNTAHKDPITIAEVNDGKDYLEDAEALAQYGRIVKTYKWEELTDPQEIKDKGLEHFRKMKAHRTITIRAVDLHIINTSVEAIRIGMKVALLSSPHGLSEPDICAKIELNVEKPDQTEYTFGYPQETLTDSNAAANQRNNTNYNHMHRWLTETNNSFDVFVDAVNSEINLKADKITLEGYVKVSDLETGVLSVLEDANIDSIHAQALAVDGNSSFHGSLDVGGSVYVEGDVTATTINGSAAAWKSKEIVTGVNYQLETATTPPFYNANGTQVSAGVTYIKNVIITPVKETINYLGHD